jgi:tetratricopeptide (TPR) repeat protein
MNLLAAFFTLSGILVYFYYKNSLNINNYRRGIIRLTISYSVLLALAVLSKENGILMPLYILTIEFFIINKKIDIERFYIWKLIFLWGPLLCLAVYLIVTFPDNLATYKSRDFTMMERLYTEPYILLDYLNKIIYPRSGVYGLLNDDYPFFKGLLNPPLAIISVITVIGLITTAIITRNKFRILSFSIIWFFSGHVLESTFLNLELYFEHRNYLPSFSIIFLIACCCYYVWKKLNHKFVGLLLAGLLAITYSGVARNEARTWESPVIQADLWYRHHPGSIRALDLKGTMYLAAGFVKQGVAVYKEFKKKYPDDLYPVIKLLFIRSCVQYEHLTQSEWNDLYDLSIKAGPQNQTFLLELDTMTTNVIEDKCAGINIENMIKLEVLLASNPVLINYMPGLHQFAALLSAKIGEFGAAYNNIEKAVETSPNVENMMIKYNILMKMGNRKQAGEVLDKIKKMLESNFKASMVYGSIYKKMRDTYRE